MGLALATVFYIELQPCAVTLHLVSSAPTTQWLVLRESAPKIRAVDRAVDLNVSDLQVVLYHRIPWPRISEGRTYM